MKKRRLISIRRNRRRGKMPLDSVRQKRWDACSRATTHSVRPNLMSRAARTKLLRLHLCICFFFEQTCTSTSSSCRRRFTSLLPRCRSRTRCLQLRPWDKRSPAGRNGTSSPSCCPPSGLRSCTFAVTSTSTVDAMRYLDLYSTHTNISKTIWDSTDL